MLQFITTESDRFSIPEEVQMVIEGGCRWVELSMKGATDEEVRNVAIELIPMCRETDTFLVIEDHIDLVNDLKVSGIHLSDPKADPVKVRETLGPHAIIGMNAETIDDIAALKGKDVDYVQVGPCRAVGLEGYTRLMAEVAAKGLETPVVAAGDIAADEIEALMRTGVNGIAVSRSVTDADDPMLYTSGIMERLLHIKN